jgi:AraC family transcriptional regulator, regulatory protein of adaptative response / methylated-DNA-[protein]-cysteine methyltransferase
MDKTAGEAIDDAAWQALSARQPWPGIYGVTSTGIFCRPCCPARPALRRNIRIFPDPAAALAAGFRACKRCGGGI